MTRPAASTKQAARQKWTVRFMPIRAITSGAFGLAVLATDRGERCELLALTLHGGGDGVKHSLTQLGRGILVGKKRCVGHDLRLQDSDLVLHGSRRMVERARVQRGFVLVEQTKCVHRRKFDQLFAGHWIRGCHVVSRHSKRPGSPRSRPPLRCASPRVITLNGSQECLIALHSLS